MQNTTNVLDGQNLSNTILYNRECFEGPILLWAGVVGTIPVSHGYGGFRQIVSVVVSVCGTEDGPPVSGAHGGDNSARMWCAVQVVCPACPATPPKNRRFS
eukprot:3291869-Amphidinium_carterae.3